MFVDDNLMAEVRGYMSMAIVASIEALFRIFGRPQPEYRKSPLSMEKFLEAICSFQKIQLGKNTNTRTMIATFTIQKIKSQHLFLNKEQMWGEISKMSSDD